MSRSLQVDRCARAGSVRLQPDQCGPGLLARNRHAFSIHFRVFYPESKRNKKMARTKQTARKSAGQVSIIIRFNFNWHECNDCFLQHPPRLICYVGLPVPVLDECQ